MVYLIHTSVFGGINIGLLFLGFGASCWASGRSDLHGGLLSVREALFYLSYALIFPSAPSGTLTMLRLASPSRLKGLSYFGL